MGLKKWGHLSFTYKWQAQKKEVESPRPSKPSPGFHQQPEYTQHFTGGIQSLMNHIQNRLLPPQTPEEI